LSCPSQLLFIAGLDSNSAGLSRFFGGLQDCSINI
jgi:hypothetical protein